MNTLVTGARGILGRELANLIPDALCPSSAELDIRDGDALRRYVVEREVARAFHCAARTDVRYCEENREDTYATNVEGTRHLCEALSQMTGASLVHVSTACVFPGDDPAACYSEEDAPAPKNYYAQSKLVAESVVSEWAEANPDHLALTVRTNFATRGPWKHPAAFIDRFGTYLYADQVAAEVLKLSDDGISGTVHVCGDRRMSMFELAQLCDPSVGQLTLAEYEGPPVTVNMSLCSVRIPPVRLC